MAVALPRRTALGRAGQPVLRLAKRLAYAMENKARPLAVGRAWPRGTVAVLDAGQRFALRVDQLE